VTIYVIWRIQECIHLHTYMYIKPLYTLMYSYMYVKSDNIHVIKIIAFKYANGHAPV